MFLEVFLYWLFLFFMYNVIGWVLESIIESVSHKRVINRGFLTGPYIPIYGVGGLLFALIGLPLKNIHHNPYVNIILVFVICSVIATLLEYAAGSILERVFKKQLWDYSSLKITNKFSYRNRISLISSLFWGWCALVVTFYFYDIFSSFISSLDIKILAVVNITMTIIMGTDAFIQIRRHGNIHALLNKLSYEQVRDFMHQSILKTGKRQQIREFRNAVFKNINENIKKNIETIRKFKPNGNSENIENTEDTEE